MMVNSSACISIGVVFLNCSLNRSVFHFKLFLIFLLERLYNVLCIIHFFGEYSNLLIIFFQTPKSEGQSFNIFPFIGIFSLKIRNYKTVEQNENKIQYELRNSYHKL